LLKYCFERCEGTWYFRGHGEVKNLLLFKKLEECTLLANSIGIQELPDWRRLQVCLVWLLCYERRQGQTFQRKGGALS